MLVASVNLITNPQPQENDFEENLKAGKFTSEANVQSRLAYCQAWFGAVWALTPGVSQQT